MRYFLLSILFISSSFADVNALDDDSEVIEEMSEDDGRAQVSKNQEDSDEEDEEESDTQQSKSDRSRKQDNSVYGDSSEQEFEEDQQYGTRADQSTDTATSGGEKVEIVEHKARFDPVTHEIVIETEPAEPQYLNKVIPIDQEAPVETDSFESEDLEESSRNITHEFIIETEPFEPRYLNDEYWAENGEDKDYGEEKPADPDESEDENTIGSDSDD